MNRTIICGVAAATMLTLTGAAHAQIKIGVTVSATGPAASLGIPEKNTVAMCPRTIAGKSVEYIVLDDASDTREGAVHIEGAGSAEGLQDLGGAVKVAEDCYGEGGRGACGE